MRAQIEEIKGDESGATLTMHIYEPSPPQYESNFSEEEKEEYEKSYANYEQRLKEYKHLRLGTINFDYEEA